MSYSLLTIIRYLDYDTGEISGYTVGDSCKVNKYINTNSTVNIIHKYNKVLKIYIGRFCGFWDS